MQRAAAEIPEPRVLLDGELVALGDDGRADFHAVRRELRRSPERLFYFAFDILFRGALDLRSLSLEKRREYLHAVLGEAGAPWLASVAVVPDGVKLLAECEKIGFEGVVSKRRDMPYRSGRRSDWVKARCERWSAENRERGSCLRRRELFTINLEAAARGRARTSIVVTRVFSMTRARKAVLRLFRPEPSRRLGKWY